MNSFLSGHRNHCRQRMYSNKHVYTNYFYITEQALEAGGAAAAAGTLVGVG